MSARSNRRLAAWRCRPGKLFLVPVMLVWVVAWGCSQPAKPVAITIPGGYTAASTSDADVIAAAEFAIADQAKLGPPLKLVSIQAAATQVVAGTNTHLSMLVDVGGKSKPAEAVVYTDLSRTQSVTAWAWR